MICSSLFFLAIASLNGGEELGKSDGNLCGWVAGKLAFKKINLQMRKTKKTKIEKIRINLYSGDSASATPRDQLLILNLVTARKYIGPIVTQK